MTRSERRKAKELARLLGCWYEYSPSSGWAIRHDSAYIDGDIIVGEPTYAHAVDYIKAHAAAFRNKVSEDAKLHIERTTGVYPDSVTDEQILSYLESVYPACRPEEVRAWLVPLADTKINDKKHQPSVIS